MEEENCATTSAMVKTIPTNRYLTQCSSQSTIHTMCFKWVISDFKSYETKIGEAMYSSDFSSKHNRNIKWRIKLFPTGEHSTVEGYVSLYLVVTPDSPRNVRAKYKLSIICKTLENSQVLESKYSRKFSQDCGWGSKKFISRKVIEDRESEWLPDDELTIYCEVKMLLNNSHISRTRELYEVKNESITLANHLDHSKMLQKSMLIDVNFLVEEHSIDAHKVLLMAKSRIFKEMFCGNDEGMGVTQIEIPGVKHETFLEMLNFIYTSNLPQFTEKLATDLLILANRFQLLDLGNECQKYLSAQLTRENVIRILIFAEAQNLYELKYLALEFLGKKESIDLLKSTEWKVLISQSPRLINDYLEVITNKESISKKKKAEKR